MSSKAVIKQSSMFMVKYKGKTFTMSISGEGIKLTLTNAGGVKGRKLYKSWSWEKECQLFLDHLEEERLNSAQRSVDSQKTVPES